jgi:hypothetical protein
MIKYLTIAQQKRDEVLAYVQDESRRLKETNLILKNQSKYTERQQIVATHRRVLSNGASSFPLLKDMSKTSRHEESTHILQAQ